MPKEMNWLFTLVRQSHIYWWPPYYNAPTPFKLEIKHRLTPRFDNYSKPNWIYAKFMQNYIQRCEHTHKPNMWFWFKYDSSKQ